MAQGDSQYSRRPVGSGVNGGIRWKEREDEGTLDEDLLDVLGPNLAGAILEHLVMLALRGDDGLAGGLTLCGVKRGWMIHGVGRN